jgi:trimethylamine monooxygenase
MGRLDKRAIYNHIRFECPVRWVTFDEETELFAVTVMNHKTGEQETEEFDYVVVATGHFSTPNMPFYEGIDQYPGRVLHAHDFRDALEYEGQDVLLVGGSYSAEDIASQCYKYGAKSVTISRRSGSYDYDWPEGINEKPGLERIEGDVVHFTDGTSQAFDAIIMCTGYIFHFPFLPDDLRLETHNCLYPDNLYKGIVFQNNPKLLYLGMQDQWFTFNMFDAQAWYARDIIMGKAQLPDEAERRKDMDLWLERHEQITTDDESIDFQARYIKDLLELSDYPSFPVEEQAELFKKWLKDKQADIMGFRNKTYQSTVTGTMAAKLPRPWLDIKDDTLEGFMSLKFQKAETTAQAEIAEAETVEA